MSKKDIVPRSDSGDLNPLGDNKNTRGSVEPQKPGGAGRLARELQAAAKAAAAEHQPKAPTPAEHVEPPKPIETPKHHQPIYSHNEPDPRQLDLEEKAEKREPPPDFSFSSRGSSDEEETVKKENNREPLPIYPVVDIPLPMAIAFITDPNSPIDSPHNTARLKMAELFFQNKWQEINTLDDLYYRMQLFVDTFHYHPRWQSIQHNPNFYFSDEQKVIKIEESLKKLSAYFDENKESRYKKITEAVSVLGELIPIVESLNKVLIYIEEDIHACKENFQQSVLLLPEERFSMQGAFGFLLAHTHFVPFASAVEYDVYKQAQKDVAVDPLAQLRASVIEIPFTAVHHDIDLPSSFRRDSDDIDFHRLQDFLKGLPSSAQIEQTYYPYIKIFQGLGQELPTAETFKMDASKLVFPNNEGVFINYSANVSNGKIREVARFYLNVFPHLLYQLFPSDLEDGEVAENTVPTATDFISWFAKRGIILMHEKHGNVAKLPGSDFESISDGLLENTPASEIIVSLPEVVRFFISSEERRELFSAREGFYKDSGVPPYALLHLKMLGIDPADFEDWQNEIEADFGSILNNLVDTLLKSEWVEKRSDKKNQLGFTQTAPEYISLGQLAEACGAATDAEIQGFCNFFKENLTPKLRYGSIRMIQNAYIDPKNLHKIMPNVLPVPQSYFGRDAEDNKEISRLRRLNCMPLLAEPHGNPLMMLGKISGEIEPLPMLPIRGKDVDEVRKLLEILGSGRNDLRYIPQMDRESIMGKTRRIDEATIKKTILHYEEKIARFTEKLKEQGLLEERDDDEDDTNYSAYLEYYKEQLLEWQKKLEEYEPRRLAFPGLEADGLLKWGRLIISSYMLNLLSTPEDVVVPDREDGVGSIYKRDTENGGWKKVTTAKSVAMAKIEEALDTYDALSYSEGAQISRPEWEQAEQILLKVAEILDTYSQDMIEYKDFESERDADHKIGQNPDEEPLEEPTLLDIYGTPIVGPQPAKISGLLQAGEVLKTEFLPSKTAFEEYLSGLKDDELYAFYDLNKYYFSPTKRFKNLLKRFFGKDEDIFGKLKPSGRVRLKMLEKEILIRKSPGYVKVDETLL